MPEASDHRSPRFAILASGRGSNACALMDSFTQGMNQGTVALVITNRPNAAVLERARERNVEALAIDHKGIEREAHEEAMLKALREYGVEHILLAGYMRILSASFLEAFPGKVINIHPSLLPDFRGLHAIERQWEAGVKVAGATVHLVTPEVDEGPIILQGSLDVRGNEGADGLASRILEEIEHHIYPRAVWLFTQREYATTNQENMP